MFMRRTCYVMERNQEEMAEREAPREAERCLRPEEDALLLEALLQYEAEQRRLQTAAEKVEEGEQQQVERAGDTATDATVKKEEEK